MWLTNPAISLCNKIMDDTYLVPINTSVASSLVNIFMQRDQTNYVYKSTDDVNTLNVYTLRLNLDDVLKMERYPPLRFSLFLGWKLTIVEQSCTLQGHFTLTSCHALIAKYSNYLLSYSSFFGHLLLFIYYKI